MESSDGSLAVGSRVVLKTKIGPVPLRWVAQHTEYDPPHLFADTQVSGPFAQWDHRHVFEGIGSETSRLTDDITYRTPLGQIGNLFGGWKARATIESMFAYRHRITTDDLQLARLIDLPPQQIAVSGATGLVGKNFCAMATLLGHDCRPIVRHPAKDEREIAIWSSRDEASKLNDVDVVVHLAGKSIADDRWTDSVKKEIMDSRVVKTRELCDAIARCDSKPHTLISASAVGIYGDRGDEPLTETSSLGDDFLADVGIQWEAATRQAEAAGVRVVHPRFGIVLSPQGGALQKMLLPAKLLGGKLGGGAQYWPWIALDDVLGGLLHAVKATELSGPVNFTAPTPLTNSEFVKVLGKVLNRPPLFPAPAFVLRTALGEMADALLLRSSRVEPTRLIESGYHFRFNDLEDQLRYCLGVDRLPSQSPT